MADAGIFRRLRSPASGSLGDAVWLEFSQRARGHGIVRHLCIFGLPAYPGISGRFFTADRGRRTCGPGIAHRVAAGSTSTHITSATSSVATRNALHYSLTEVFRWMWLARAMG